MILFDAHFPGNQKLITDLNRDLHGETLVELLFSRQTYERCLGAVCLPPEGGRRSGLHRAALIATDNHRAPLLYLSFP